MIGEGLCVALRSDGMSVDLVRNAPDGEAALREGGYVAARFEAGALRPGWPRAGSAPADPLTHRASRAEVLDRPACGAKAREMIPVRHLPPMPTNTAR